MDITLHLDRSVTLFEHRLSGLLDMMTTENEAILRARPDLPLLYESGVVYTREDPGDETWLFVDEVLESPDDVPRDCEDLVMARVAELRVRRGIAARPVWRWQERAEWRGGRMVRRRKYHILVEWPGGHLECPSRILGMGRGLEV